MLITTAMTREGVPELLAAIERHRAALADVEGGIPVRRARAAALIWALLGDRVRRRLEDPDLATATSATLDAVVRHDLDPYAAADRLLAALVGGGNGGGDRGTDRGADGGGDRGADGGGGSRGGDTAADARA